jgi:hypothetical protein
MFLMSGFVEADTAAAPIGYWDGFALVGVGSTGTESILTPAYGYVSNGSTGFDMLAETDTDGASAGAGGNTGFNGSFDCDYNSPIGTTPSCYGDTTVTFNWVVSYNYTAILSGPGDYAVYLGLVGYVYGPNATGFYWDNATVLLNVNGMVDTNQQTPGLTYSDLSIVVSVQPYIWQPVGCFGHPLNGGTGGGHYYDGVYTWASYLQASVWSYSATTGPPTITQLNIGSGNGGASPTSAGATLQSVILSGSCLA